MPVIPNFIERMLLIKLNKGPGPMLDMLGALAFKVVFVAVKLGVLQALKGGYLTAEEVAQKIDAHKRGTMLLLKALEAVGYVQEENGRYTNTNMVTKWMLPDSPSDISDAFVYWDGLLERWGYLEEVVRHGESPISAWEWFDNHPKGWEYYHAAMMATARLLDDEIISKVKCPPMAHRLLDLGGGHGLHAVNFCRRYRDLSATVLDLPHAKEIAEKTIAAEGMTDRVTFQEGDFWEMDLGSGYDIALLFNIIHMYSPHKNSDLLRRVSGALSPGGIAVIADEMAIKTSGPTAKATAALIGMDLFLEVRGQTYAPDDVMNWLMANGYTSPSYKPLRNSPGFALVLGTRGD